MISKELLQQKLKEKTQRQALKETGGAPRAAGFHRHAYHRNFEGWTEVTIKRPDGRTYIDHIYTGRYYEPALTAGQRVGIRLLYLTLSLLGGILYAFMAFRDTFCNKAPYVVMFQSLTLLMMLWFFYTMFFYILTPGLMTIGDYNTIHKPVIRSALVNVLCMWATAAASLISFFLYFTYRPYMDLLCSLGFAAAGIMLSAIYLMEQNLEYKIVKNDTEPPEDGTEIE